ncbi:motility associated factor glycosyltransferase family protein [Paenibacillus sp. SI8]|uniref:motility associated factor glycosyltransferase family protein n=1 Tax=unclassified Paenibacillus TaxID=185978 RepID=UPI003465827F
MSERHHFIQKDDPRFHAPDVTLERARNGSWTALIHEYGVPPVYLHSRYDPIVEANRFAASQLSSFDGEDLERIVLYGVGCGYHVSALLEQTESQRIPIEVWETNVAAFLYIKQSGAVTEIMNNPRLTLVVTDDLKVFGERVNAWQGDCVHVIVHEPSLRAMPAELEFLKRILQDYKIKHNSAIINKESMHHNFMQNTRQGWPSVSTFQSFPSSVPAILISAGPSLAKALPLLQTAAKHCLLGAVGTASSLLVRHGIRPDFIVMTDPQQGMIRQLEGWETAEIPLLFLSTVNSEVVDQYAGPKFILFQEGFVPAEKMAALRSEPLVQTGGSVSTTLFSLARLLSMRPLCLVGQDLAYTDNQTHAVGAPLYKRWEQQASGERVLAFDRKGTVVTSRNLLVYKKWFEEQARSSNEIYFNATEGGAYIDGFAHVTLSEFLTTLQLNDVSKEREEFQRLVRSASMN